MHNHFVESSCLLRVMRILDSVVFFIAPSQPCEQPVSETVISCCWLFNPLFIFSRNFYFHLFIFGFHLFTYVACQLTTVIQLVVYHNNEKLLGVFTLVHLIHEYAVMHTMKCEVVRVCVRVEFIYKILWRCLYVCTSIYVSALNAVNFFGLQQQYMYLRNCCFWSLIKFAMLHVSPFLRTLDRISVLQQISCDMFKDGLICFKARRNSFSSKVVHFFFFLICAYESFSWLLPTLVVSTFCSSVLTVVPEWSQFLP